MDKKLSQSSKEAKKLRDEISFLKQHLICVIKEKEQLKAKKLRGKIIFLQQHLIRVIKENEQLILENLFMDEKLCQSRKEAKKLRDEISFLQQHLICVIKENGQLILEMLLMDEKLRQSSKETKKLWEEISFLQQKMQPCDQPVQIKHNIAVGEVTESGNVWLCSKPHDIPIYQGPVIAKVKPAVWPR
jgi:regulator of replication initiation timing